MIKTTLEEITSEKEPPLEGIEGTEESTEPDKAVSYNEITEAIEQAEAEETLCSKKYLDDSEVQTAEDKFYLIEETDYETDSYTYKHSEDTDEDIENNNWQDDFFDVEIDYVILLVPDDPIEDFREYYGIKENAFAMLKIPLYNGGEAKRFVKNILAA